MTGKTHLAFGGLASFALMPFVPEYHFTFLLLGALGGLMPDLDASESAIKHLGIPITRRLWFKPFWLPASIIALCCTHRGGVHSLFGMMIFTAILATGWYTLSPGTVQIAGIMAFALGYLSHLFGDACTKSGVPILYPFSNTPWHLLPRSLTIRTGGLGEVVFDLTFLLLTALIILTATLHGWILVP